MGDVAMCQAAGLWEERFSSEKFPWGQGGKCAG